MRADNDNEGELQLQLDANLPDCFNKCYKTMVLKRVGMEHGGRTTDLSLQFAIGVHAGPLLRCPLVKLVCLN